MVFTKKKNLRIQNILSHALSFSLFSFKLSSTLCYLCQISLAVCCSRGNVCLCMLECVNSLCQCCLSGSFSLFCWCGSYSECLWSYSTQTSQHTPVQNTDWLVWRCLRWWITSWRSNIWSSSTMANQCDFCVSLFSVVIFYIWSW